MNELVQKFSASAPPEQWRDVHVAVALSGGADSVALLRATIELKKTVAGKGVVTALHVNHHLRGAESDADAQWCKQLCQQLDVRCEILDGHVSARAAEEGDGIEAAARNERYALLTAAAESQGARLLFLAHTADDQAETILFRILRGTGIRGLGGISARRALSPALTAVRPLLDCTRSEVVAYLAGLGQDFRTDSSNASREFARNRIRTELLPFIKQEFNPNIHETLLRLANHSREVQNYIESQALEVLENNRERVTPGEIVLRVQSLKSVPEFLVTEALRIAWREASFPEQAMTHQWWQQLAALAIDGGAALNLPGDLRAEVVGDRLVVRF